MTFRRFSPSPATPHPHFCFRCKKKLEGYYWENQSLGRRIYCPKDFAFFLSRYSFLTIHGEIGEEELAEKRLWDDMVKYPNAWPPKKEENVV